jgi:transcriptional regulator with XRE-family HTH domain
MSPKKKIKLHGINELISDGMEGKPGVKSLGVNGFARTIGISPALVTRYMQGKIGEPTTATLEKLGVYFGVSVAWLRGDVLVGEAHDANENNLALSLAAGNFDTFNREIPSIYKRKEKYLFRDIALLVLTLPDGFYDPVLLERSKTAAKKLLEDFEKNSKGPANKGK